jgi:hypothetical protein
MPVFKGIVNFLFRRKKMKRFWLILLSLGLITAFSTSALALDVKFSGSFYAAGMYLDKTSLAKSVASTDNVSTAFYFQRLRLQTDFVVSPGLTLVTRLDAMERIWGGNRSATGTTLDIDSAGTRAENENIAFDWAYIDYVSPIGIFDVGIMNDGKTGTIFGDSYLPAGRIKYSLPLGAFTLNADITKVKDQSYSAVTTTTAFTDGDQDKYGLEGMYKWTNGLAGMKVTYYNYADKSPGTSPAGNYKKQYFLFTPYAIFKIGPVDIQAELNYATGSLKKYGDGVIGLDVKLENLNAFIDATVTLGPIYFGGAFAYISGDDPATTDKQEGGTATGGRDWNPCLIMFNYYDRTYWVGPLNGYGVGNAGTSSTSGYGMGTDSLAATAPGAWFGQGRVGVRPIAQLDILASVSYAQADKKPAVALNNAFGWEIDVTGTYKITNNLSYMLGVGYWFVGDYYKGASNYNELRDNYMLINKLTLTF